VAASHNALDLAEWKAAVSRGEAPPQGSIRKAVKVSKVAEVPGGRKLAWIISTGNPDRVNDCVNPKGGDWAAWVDAGAPVLWAHDYAAPPIAQGSLPRLVNESKLRSVADFGPEGIHPFSDLIYELARPRDGKPGRLRAASIGFRPVEWTFNEERRGFDFQKFEGLEWSVVPVPMHQEAVQEAAILRSYADSLGLDLGPLRDFAEKILDSGKATPEEKAGAEAMHKATAPLTVSVDKALDALLVVGKRGRVLSASNEERIRGARGNADELVRALDEVLAQVEAEAEAEEAKPPAEPEPEKAEPAPEPEPEKAIEPAPDVVLRLVTEPVFRLPDGMTSKDLRSAMSSALKAETDRLRYELTGRLPD
jgi:hypothetical protein